MDDQLKPIDDYTLAAFMAGTLPEQRRAEVIAYLANNADARELLKMACEAYEHTELDPAKGDAPRLPRKADRETRPAVHRRFALPKFTRIAVTAVFLIAAGLGIRQALLPDEMSQRGGSGEFIQLSLPRSVTDLSFNWEDTPGADRYFFVIWDTEAAQIVAEYETKTSEIDPDGEFAEDLAAKLEPGRSYAVRVDAIDARNRLVESSRTESFVLKN